MFTPRQLLSLLGITLLYHALASIIDHDRQEHEDCTSLLQAPSMLSVKQRWRSNSVLEINSDYVESVEVGLNLASVEGELDESKGALHHLHSLVRTMTLPQSLPSHP